MQPGSSSLRHRSAPLVTLLGAFCLSALLLTSLGEVSSAFAGRVAPEATSMEMAEAKAIWKKTASLVRERRSTSEELAAALEQLAEAHAAVGAESSEARSYRKKAEDLLLKAALLHKSASRSDERNVRLELNVKAIALLGRIGAGLEGKAAHSLALGVQRAITFIQDKRDTEQWEPAQLDALFAALAEINDPASITWILDEHTHTKKREVAFLIAAQQALLRFHDVPGRLRYDICKKIAVTYAGVEALAERNSASSTDRASKELWDALRVHTIPLLQQVSGAPRDEKDEALSTVSAFQRWIQENKNLRQAPWLDSETR